MYLSRYAEDARTKEYAVDFVQEIPDIFANLSAAIAPITVAFVAWPGNGFVGKSQTAACSSPE
jgi:hypothetical protein